MFGSFGRKNKSFGGNYGKKDTSKFKKAVIAGGLVLAVGSGIYASKGDTETHQEIEYPTTATEEGGMGHQAELVARQELAGQVVGVQAAPAPAIDLATAQAALVPPNTNKAKIGAGLRLAGDVVVGDVGKVGAVKKGIDIARGQGEAASTKSLQDQIKAAEQNSKRDRTKISRGSVGVGRAPMIGPIAPPEFFEQETKNRKQKVAGFFAKKRG